jgi:hypothetical protein
VKYTIFDDIACLYEKGAPDKEIFNIVRKKLNNLKDFKEISYIEDVDGTPIYTYAYQNKEIVLLLDDFMDTELYAKDDPNFVKEIAELIIAS